ncbi:MAG: Glu/Leu/Phe/Val dehydrogenase [Comamonadaceae bacterium]|nr:MAG: Glu/Leu/Phe/Val dehydrogenase [Comamonadaceae bacterium]
MTTLETKAVPPAPPSSTSILARSFHKEYDFFKVVQEYLDQAARAINLEPFVRAILSQPKNELIINFPVKMDNGEVRLFKGYRVQHNNLLGPFKGGMRFHPGVTLDDVKALASMMTWKAALMRLPYGGGKGGVKFDPQEVSKAELQRITRRFTHALGENIGPEVDIPAPDVGTNAQTMAWMMDTYSMNEGMSATGVVTGKPISLGGSLGRVEATGRGVYVVGCEAARDIGFDVVGARVVVQGFGNVGGTAARLFYDTGAKIIAVQDHTGIIHNEFGLDVPDLLAHVANTGGVGGFEGAQVIDNDTFWALETEFLIPAALESQIHTGNAGTIRAKVVVEGANGPTTPEADDILKDNGIMVVPDVLANAGGVTVSYFEWVQDFSSFFWSEDEINHRLERIMRDAYAAVSKTAHDENVSLRTAAFIVACTRILQARQVRGLYP